MNKFLSVVRDKFNLYKRIKKINKNYELLFNQKTKNYEIHDKSKAIGSLCLIVYPQNLNSLVIKKLFVTRRENMKKLFLEIEKENKILEEKSRQKTLMQSSDTLREIIDYSSRQNHDLSQSEIHELIQKMGE